MRKDHTCGVATAGALMLKDTADVLICVFECERATTDNVFECEKTSRRGVGMHTHSDNSS